MPARGVEEHVRLGAGVGAVAGGKVENQLVAAKLKYDAEPVLRLQKLEVCVLQISRAFAFPPLEEYGAPVLSNPAQPLVIVPEMVVMGVDNDAVGEKKLDQPLANTRLCSNEVKPIILAVDPVGVKYGANVGGNVVYVGEPVAPMSAIAGELHFIKLEGAFVQY
jgi:hypothetical protein